MKKAFVTFCALAALTISPVAASAEACGPNIGQFKAKVSPYVPQINIRKVIPLYPTITDAEALDADYFQTTWKLAQFGLKCGWFGCWYIYIGPALSTSVRQSNEKGGPLGPCKVEAAYAKP